MRRHQRGIGARLGRLSLETILSWFMKLSLAGIVPYLIIKGLGLLEAGRYPEAKESFVVAGAAVIALFISLAPSLISRSAQITLPWLVDFVITLVLYLHVALGGAMGLYYVELPLPYDKVLHLFSTVMISVLAFMFVFTLYYTRRIRLSLTFMAIFIIMVAMGLGGIWEILEWSLDKVAGTSAQTGLDDTMIDMILDLCGGTIAAIGGTLYARWSKPKHQRRFAVPLAQLFGYLPRPSRKKEKEQETNEFEENSGSDDD